MYVASPFALLHRSDRFFFFYPLFILKIGTLNFLNFLFLLQFMLPLKERENVLLMFVPVEKWRLMLSVAWLFADPFDLWWWWWYADVSIWLFTSSIWVFSIVMKINDRSSIFVKYRKWVLILFFLLSHRTLRNKELLSFSKNAHKVIPPLYSKIYE